MGMFDWVEFYCDCPRCQHEVGRFQSKDGPRMLASLEYWEVDKFYMSCDNCGSRIVFYLEDDNLKIPEELKRHSIKYNRKIIPIESYRMEINKPEHPRRD